MQEGLEPPEKPLEMSHFQALAYPEEVELAPSRASGAAPDGQNEINGSAGRNWTYNRCRLRSHNGNSGQDLKLARMPERIAEGARIEAEGGGPWTQSSRPRPASSAMA